MVYLLTSTPTRLSDVTLCTTSFQVALDLACLLMLALTLSSHLFAGRLDVF